MTACSTSSREHLWANRTNTHCPKGTCYKETCSNLPKAQPPWVQKSKSLAAPYLLSLKTARTWRRWTIAWWATCWRPRRCWQRRPRCLLVTPCWAPRPSPQECPWHRAALGHSHRRTGPSSGPASAGPPSPAAGCPRWWGRTTRPASTRPVGVPAPWPSAALQSQNPCHQSYKLQDPTCSPPKASLHHSRDISVMSNLQCCSAGPSHDQSGKLVTSCTLCPQSFLINHSLESSSLLSLLSTWKRGFLILGGRLWLPVPPRRSRPHTDHSFNPLKFWEVVTFGSCLQSEMYYQE